MKAAAANQAHHGQNKNFYTCNLAPVHDREKSAFRGWDAALLVILCLEVAVMMRHFLAD